MLFVILIRQYKIVPDTKRESSTLDKIISGVKLPFHNSLVGAKYGLTFINKIRP